MPHVTLAHRMTADQVAVALGGARPAADGYAVGVRVTATRGGSG